MRAVIQRQIVAAFTNIQGSATGMCSWYAKGGNLYCIILRVRTTLWVVTLPPEVPVATTVTCALVGPVVWAS
jgi:hypothetical protein